MLRKVLTLLVVGVSALLSACTGSIVSPLTSDEAIVASPENKATYGCKTSKGQVCIYGLVYWDENVDGTKAIRELGRPWWTMELVNKATGAKLSQQTTAAGKFAFNVAKGDYSLCVVKTDGYFQTQPRQGQGNACQGHDVNPLHGSPYKIFGMAKKQVVPPPQGALSGTVKVTKLNSSTQKPIPGWKIVLDCPGTLLDAVLLTDENGVALFKKLEVSESTLTCDVIEEARLGWTPKDGKPLKQTVTLTAEKPSAEIVFENVPIAIVKGVKFDDLNNDGIQQAGEPGLAGWTLTLSGCANLTTVSGVNGVYEFVGASTAVPCTLTETAQVGWKKISAITFSVTAGEVKTVNIANFKLATIECLKLTDANGNGVLEASDIVPLEGMKFELKNANTTFLTVTDAEGKCKFLNVSAGTYTLDEVVPDGYIKTFPVAGYQVVVNQSGQVFGPYKFGNFKKAIVQGKVIESRTRDLIDPTIVVYRRVGTVVQEEVARVDSATGEFQFILGPGSYRVQVLPVSGYRYADPRFGYYDIVIDQSGQEINLDFFISPEI